MLLGLAGDVNRATAGEMADDAFQGAVVPVARLVAEHITRDVFAKCVGWREFEFVFNDLESRNAQEEDRDADAAAERGRALGGGSAGAARAAAGRHGAAGGRRNEADDRQPRRARRDRLQRCHRSLGARAASHARSTRLRPRVGSLPWPAQRSSRPLAEPASCSRATLPTGPARCSSRATSRPSRCRSTPASRPKGRCTGSRSAPVSDEWLLDKQAGSLGADVLGQPAGAAVEGLLARLAPGLFTTTGVAPGQSVGVLAPGMLGAGASFSSAAGAIASATCAAYRALDGGLTLTPRARPRTRFPMATAPCRWPRCAPQASRSSATTSPSPAPKNPPPIGRKSSWAMVSRPPSSLPASPPPSRTAMPCSSPTTSLARPSTRSAGPRSIPARTSRSARRASR